MPGQGRTQPLSPLELQNQRANQLLAERHGYNAAAVARAVQVTEATVRHWYRGRRRPAGEVAERYAAFLTALDPDSGVALIAGLRDAREADEARRLADTRERLRAKLDLLDAEIAAGA